MTDSLIELKNISKTFLSGEKKINLFNNVNLKIKKVMKKNPISVDKNMLAAEALSIMNSKKITSLCVHQNNKKSKTIGFIHIHNILDANIT